MRSYTGPWSTQVYEEDPAWEEVIETPAGPTPEEQRQQQRLMEEFRSEKNEMPIVVRAKGPKKQDKPWLMSVMSCRPKGRWYAACGVCYAGRVDCTLLASPLPHVDPRGCGHLICRQCYMLLRTSASETTVCPECRCEVKESLTVTLPPVDFDRLLVADGR